MKNLRQVHIEKDEPKIEIKFLLRDEIDCLLLNIFKELDTFSHEEASSVFQLLKFLSRNARRPFTPFYNDGHSLNCQVRKGWIHQIQLLPPLFTCNSEFDSFYEMIKNRTNEICGEMYQIFGEFINDIKKAKNKKLWLKNMERAAIAYQLPKHMRINFLINSKLHRKQASDFLNKIEYYVVKVNGS